MEIDGLARFYGEREALAGVSLTLAQGQTLVVLGPNGAGKTTLLRVLATLLRPHAGTVRVFGEPLPEQAWRVRARIGLLAHEPLLYRELTARENLRFHARLHGVAPPRIEELVGRLELTARADEPLRTLSRGLVQRVAIARAVLHEPQLLLLDEPYANLDPAVVALAQPLIGAAPGRARVVCSHDPSGAMAEADLVLGLRAGRPALLGAPAELEPDRIARAVPVSPAVSDTQPASPPTGAQAASPPARAATGRPAPRSSAPGTAATVAAVLRKELLVELRTLESVPGMSLFAVTTFVVFHFALNRSSVDGDLAAGILWVTLLFAAMLGVNRLFVADADQGGLDAFLLAPVDRSALALAKALALLIYLAVLEVVAVPAFALLLLGPSLSHALPGLLAVLALGDLGVAAIGTLVAALAVRTRARDLLGPLIALPLLVPVVIGAARASSPLLATGHGGGAGARWLLLLGLYDLVFGLIAYAVFDFLLED